MPALQNIELKEKGKATVLCQAAQGTLDDTTKKITLNNPNWGALDINTQLTKLQKQVALTATITRSGVGKSYAKTMYIISISPGAKTVTLGEQQES